MKLTPLEKKLLEALKGIFSDDSTPDDFKYAERMIALAEGR